jgi:phosphoribosylformylglycinamidine (FGAM) synthase-like amidotransferase family enzyme
MPHPERFVFREDHYDPDWRNGQGDEKWGSGYYLFQSVFEAVEGVSDVKAQNNHVVLTFGGDMGALLKAAEGRYNIVDISTQSADLEEIFLTYYQDEDAPAEEASA